MYILLHVKTSNAIPEILWLHSKYRIGLVPDLHRPAVVNCQAIPSMGYILYVDVISKCPGLDSNSLTLCMLRSPYHIQ
jgi:hypothetical protein